MTIEKVQELSERWLRKQIDDRTLEKLLFKIVEIAKNTNSIEELNIVLDMNNVEHCLNNFIYAFILGVENKVFSWKLIEDIYNKWGVDNIELYEDDSGEFLRRGDWETIRLPRVFESYTPWFFSRSQYTEHLKTFIFHPEATTIQRSIICECDTLETIIMPKHLVPVKALDRRDHYHFSVMHISSMSATRLRKLLFQTIVLLNGTVMDITTFISMVYLITLLILEPVEM